MLQITPQMKILVAVEPADFRRGIDALGGFARRPCNATPSSAPSSSYAIAKRRR